MKLLSTIKSTNRESSRIHEINGNRYPDKKLGFWIGKMIFSIRFHHGVLVKIAASSISPDSCSIAPVADLVANGMYLIAPTSTSRKNDPYKNDHLTDKASYAIPNAIEGIRYGIKARGLTILDNFECRLFTTA